MKISKSFKIYIHIILLFLLTQSLNAAEDFSKNIIIHEKPTKITELKFKDSDLQDVDLTNKKGNIMILNFWATWCAPCKREMPSLEKLTFKYPEIKVFAVNTEKPNKILPILEDFSTISLVGYGKSIEIFKQVGKPSNVVKKFNLDNFSKMITNQVDISTLIN